MNSFGRFQCSCYTVSLVVGKQHYCCCYKTEKNKSCRFLVADMHKVHSFVSFKVATRISNFQDCVWEVANQKETVTQRKSPRKLPTKKKKLNMWPSGILNLLAKKIKISFFLKTKKGEHKRLYNIPRWYPTQVGREASPSCCIV